MTSSDQPILIGTGLRKSHGGRSVLHVDRIELRPTIESAVEICRQGDWQLGLQLLGKASRRAEEGDELPAVFYSHTGFGVARYQRQLAEGERLCRHAVRLDPSDPEHLRLLAEVCVLRRKRKAAVDAILKGLRIDPGNAPLRRLQKKIGFRRPPVIRFLSRDNPLNWYLGQRRHRRESRR